MGYLHIENLYKCRDILLFKQCYAMEKIHGTSAHILWKDGKLQYSSGGSKHATFLKLFDNDALTAKCQATFGEKKAFVYGEAYGGKLQGMSETYGKEQKFIVFDVQIDGMWLAVPQADQVAQALGLEFVDYTVIPTDIECMNAERDKPSTQAKRNGIKGDKLREGVVLRPLIEVIKNNGERVIAKHKNDEFKETATARDVSEEELKVLEDADAIATEWVTVMRAQHIIDKFGFQKKIEATPIFIKYMVADVEREAAGEVVWGNEVKRAISKKAALLFKHYVTRVDE